MSRKKIFALVAPALLIAGGPQTLLVHRGMTIESLNADAETCREEARLAQSQPSNTAYLPMRLAEIGMRGDAAYDACIYNLKYWYEPMSAEQAKAYNKLKTPLERQQFMVDFSNGYFAKKDAPPPLPPNSEAQ